MFHGTDVGTDVVWQDTWDEVDASWTDFMDAETGVVEYVVCAGTSPFAEDVLPCTSVGADTTVSIVGIGGSRRLNTVRSSARARVRACMHAW